MKLPRVEIFQGVNDDGEYNGQFYWRLRAANNEIVATGEAYTSREDAKRGFIDAASTFNEAVIEWFCSSFGKTRPVDGDHPVIVEFGGVDSRRRSDS